jgi:hypothetical protein
MSKMSLVGISEIRALILELRGQKIILDRDIAALYDVSTRALIQAVKRNKKRFPNDFMFQLNNLETEFLVSQNVIPHKKYFGGRNPYAFTRNGANMLSAVLRSPIAIRRSIQIMRAFSVLEEVMGKRKRILTKSPDIINKLSTHSKAIMQLFQKDNIKTKEIKKIKKIINEMIDLLKKRVFESL